MREVVSHLESMDGIELLPVKRKLGTAREAYVIQQA